MAENLDILSNFEANLGLKHPRCYQYFKIKKNDFRRHIYFSFQIPNRQNLSVNNFNWDSAFLWLKFIKSSLYVIWNFQIYSLHFLNSIIIDVWSLEVASLGDAKLFIYFDDRRNLLKTVHFTSPHSRILKLNNKNFKQLFLNINRTNFNIFDILE